MGKKKEKAAGGSDIPEWLVTFADLMSILVCFFVLIISFSIQDDEKLVLDFLTQEKILLVQGTAFNWPNTDHLRVVFLPRKEDLGHAIGRFGEFLSRY